MREDRVMELRELLTADQCASLALLRELLLPIKSIVPVDATMCSTREQVVRPAEHLA